MKSQDKDRLRELLRRGDPAAGRPQLSDEDRAALRSEIVGTAREARRRPERASPLPGAWRPAAVAAAGLLFLGLGVALWLVGPTRGPGPVTPPAERAGRVEGREIPPTPRQIHFTTPGGTRVVWVLYPADRSTNDPGRSGGRSHGGTT